MDGMLKIFSPFFEVKAILATKDMVLKQLACLLIYSVEETCWLLYPIYKANIFLLYTQSMHLQSKK